MKDTKLTIAAVLTIPSEKFQDIFGQTNDHDRFYSNTSTKTTLSPLQVKKLLDVLNIDQNRLLFSEPSEDSTDAESKVVSFEALKCQINVEIKS